VPDARPETDALGRLFSGEQVGQRWNVPADTVRAWARRGRLPCVKLGTLIRFREEDLVAFLDRGAAEREPARAAVVELVGRMRARREAERGG